MPVYYPATDPFDLPVGAVGQMSRLEYVALMLNGGIGHPKIHAVTPGQASHIAAVVHTFLGESFIQPGWKQATLTRDVGVANASIVWTAVQPGEGGNAISIEFTSDANPVHISAAGNLITVKLQNAVTTAAATIAELALHEPMAAMVQAALSPGHSGAGLPTTGAAANLTGGAGLALCRAELQIGPSGGGNNAIMYRARRPGVVGNSTTVAYVNTLGSNIMPVVTVTGTAISASIFAGTTTAANVLRALWRSVDAMALVSAHSPYGDTAAGTPAAVVAAPLAAGADGTAVSATLGGAVGVVTNISPSAVVVSVPTVAGSAAADLAVAELDICGFLSRVSMPVI